MNIKKTAFSLLPCLALFLPVQNADAIPYASGLTNQGGAVSFILNESADDVKLIVGGVTNNLGALPAGEFSTNVGGGSPVFVQVTKNSGAGFKTAVSNFSGTISWAGKIQISSDPVNARFPTPRGVAVNKNPASPHFGRIYVANSTPGVTGVGSRSVGRGLYVLNADFSDSANGYGDNAQTGGITFADGNQYSPLRISVGDDSFVYISDFSDAVGTVYRTDGNLQTGEVVLAGIGGPTAVPEGQNHGSTIKVVAEGSLDAGTLNIFTIDEDLPGGTPSNNDLWSYNIGSGPLPSSVPPVHVSSVLLSVALASATDFVRGPNGYYYVVQNRANPATAPCLFVLDSNGTTITDTEQLWREFTGDSTIKDALINIHSVAISPDGNYLAAIRLSTGNSDTWIIPLTNGIPDMSRLKLLDTGAVTQGRGVDFDAAGNLYTVSSGDALLRAFSPGGTTTTITGTDGTFEVKTPPATVSIVASTNSVSEGGNSTLTISRVGETSGALTVNFTISGTASNSVDFSSLPSSVVLPAGVGSTNILIPITQDAEPELTETIVINLTSSLNYEVGNPSSVTISILDDESPVLNISAVQNRLLENYSFATATFQIRRLGLISGSLTANVNYSGTAAVGSDFNGPSAVTLAANAATTNIVLTPINNRNYSGNKSIIVTLASGSGYAVGATNTATGTLIDDENPAGQILFADDFDVDSTANWNVFSIDSFFDSGFEFAYDYGQAGIGIPPAPNTTNGTTRGLRMFANQVFGQISGISASPVGQQFTGDYRLTFDVWMNFNGPLAAGAVGSTEVGSAGVATSGATVQWSGGNLGNIATQDGVWFGWNSDGDVGVTTDLADYNAYVPEFASPLPSSSGAYTAGTNLLSRDGTDPFYVMWGRATAPAAQLATYPGPGTATNQTGAVRVGALGMSWHTMSVTKQGTNVIWTIDGVPIATVDITRYLPISEGGSTPSGYTLGENITLGYDDPFASTNLNGAVSFGLFDNVRVETIVEPSIAPSITKIQIVGNDVVIDFTGAPSDTVGSFKLQSVANLGDVFGDDNAAAIQSTGAGTFRATAPVTSGTRFYRIRHL